MHALTRHMAEATLIVAYVASFNADGQTARPASAPPAPFHSGYTDPPVMAAASGPQVSPSQYVATIHAYKARAKDYAAQAAQARSEFLLLEARGDLQAASAVSNRWALADTRRKMSMFLAQREELMAMLEQVPPEAQGNVRAAIEAIDAVMPEYKKLEALWLAARQH